jgi:Cdc6-like AAA superfamily ATPase
VEKNRKRREWLSPKELEMWPIHLGIRNKVEDSNPTAGEWLLQEYGFKEWRDSKISTGFWLKGDLGTGKTVLCSTVINHLRGLHGDDERKRSMAYFYCSSSSPLRRSADEILKSILKQLTESDLGLQAFSSWFEKKAGSKEDLTRNQVRGVLQEIIESLGNVQTTIIIDGLDELVRDEIVHNEHELVYDELKALLSVLERLLGHFENSNKGLLKILVSSRNSASKVIKPYLINWTPFDILFGLSEADMKRYISSQVRNYSRSLSEEQFKNKEERGSFEDCIIKGLRDRAEGS